MHKGVLFDFDGVLAETMEDFFRAWEATFKEFGYSLDKEEFFLMEGMHTTKVASAFCKKGSIPNSQIKNILRKKEAYYGKNHKFKFYPGVENLISNLKRNKVPLSIVTAGTKERLAKTVPADFLSNFNSIVTKETEGNGKPFPDPYLRGASDLNLSPAECIVVENAPMGIKAAKSAGAYCVAIASTLAKKYLSEADAVVKNFSELKKLGPIYELIKA